MDFIKELGLTLMVGVFSILGFEAIMHYFFNRPITGLFQEILKKPEILGKESTRTSDAQPEPKQTVRDPAPSQPENGSQREHTATVVLFVAAAFAIGIVAEDLSYKYVDSSLPFTTLPAKVVGGWTAKRLGLPADDDDRVSALIGQMENPQITPLVLDLADSNAFLISDHSKVGEKVQNWLKSNPRCKPGSSVTDCPSAEEIEKAFINLYYFAKNTAYSNEYHYDELRKIQARLEFTRSLSMIALWYFFCGLAIAIALLMKSVFRRKDRSALSIRLQRLRSKMPTFLLVLLVVYFFSLWAFARETDAFNRRAFGYLSSSLLENKRQLEQQRLAEEAKNQREAERLRSSPPTPEPSVDARPKGARAPRP